MWRLRGKCKARKPAMFSDFSAPHSTFPSDTSESLSVGPVERFGAVYGREAEKMLEKSLTFWWKNETTPNTSAEEESVLKMSCTCLDDGRVLTAVFVVLSLMSSAVTPRVPPAGLEPQIDKQWVSSRRRRTNTGDSSRG